MSTFLRTRAPTGRPWTAREIAQGMPLGHPTHAVLVHFPVAFFLGALALDVASRWGRFPAAPLAATWALVAGALAAVPTALTGLLDRAGMVRGSTKRRWATRHALVQAGAVVLFVLALLLRLPDRGRPEAEALWIGVEAVGAAVLVVGQWLGGMLVYRMGMRVSTGSPSGG
ncbi:MAG TPA: DUF2231 domain-containing protein [Actinomycetota bacterium]|nr:DUF2231 domain-containing protein [Actinomycetota bacterium]